MAGEHKATVEKPSEPAVAPLRSSRHRIFAVFAATASGGALDVAASAIAAPPLWAAALLLIGAVAVSLIAEGFVARWRESGMQQPVERLFSAVRDQWIAEANQQHIIDHRRLTLRLRRAEQSPTLFTRRLLVDGADLADVWLGKNRRSARWLVLLGDKGAGKSELLIAMMVDLLRDRKPVDQIPVLIPIASWTATATDDLVSSQDGVLVDLYTWLEQWLISSYAFLAEHTKDGPTLAKALLDLDKIAFVFDGFDELPAHARREALRLLVNDGHRRRRILLTSRTAEYEQAAGRPLVANPDAMVRPLIPFPGIGIQVAPLEQGQVVDYLYRGAADPTRWGPLAERLDRDAAVQSVFDTPLMTMLVDTLYNRDEDGQAPRADVPPIGQLAAMEPARMRQLLFGEFLPARYGNAVSAANARRWLHQLVLSAVIESQPAQPFVQDIAWWRLGSPRLPSGPARAAILAGGGVAAFLWTAVSAGLLNSWVFHDAATGVTDALRVGLAAVICYTSLLALTRSSHAAVVAALGAYIGGSISGVYELALVTGLAAGFSWRPVTLARGGTWRAVMLGVVAALAPLPVRLAERYGLLPLEPSLTEGFAAGFADGWVSGWDQDVNGALATAVVVTMTAALGMRFTPTARPISTSGRASNFRGWHWLARRIPITVGSLAGTLVFLVNSTADAARPQLSHAYLLAPAEGLAVGLVVWVAAMVITARTPSAAQASWRPWAAAAAVGLAMAVLSGMGNTAKGDVHDGWARGLADGVTAALVVWSVLKYEDGRWKAAAVPGSPHRPWTPMLALRILLPAFAAGAAVGALYGISAPTGPAAAYGAAVVAIVLSRPWWSVWRTDAAQAAAEKGPLPPFAVGLASLIVVGLIAGMGYGLIYGLLAGLASKVTADIAYRSYPSLGRRTSRAGIMGGVLLGATVAAAASVTGIDPRWLPLIGVSAALAASLAFGTQGVAKPNTVMSPRRLLARDRGVFLTSALIVAAAIGVAVGVRTSARGEAVATAVIAAFTTSSTYGLTAGLAVAAAQSRTVVYLSELTMLATRGLLPWRLMTFLDDAYNKGVLRQYGPVYRFRHQELAAHLSVEGTS
jgi:hypothetical protein